MSAMLSLRARVLITFAIMVALVGTGAGGMVWYACQNDSLIGTMVGKEMVLYKTAQEMELALANQKGFLTYYFVDGDEKWLDSLAKYRQMFDQCINLAMTFALNSSQRETLARISTYYKEYIEAKNRAIASYSSTAPKRTISELHERQRVDFFRLLELCRTFRESQRDLILSIEQQSKRRSATLRLFAYTGIAIFVAVGGVFLSILYRQILTPLRGLVIRAGGDSSEKIRDEVDSLKQSLQSMIRDFDETTGELARSRKSLLQAERMAMVGELAAGVAHTIRNPFTSIKMRMFSLSRSLELDEVQNEDLRVITEEIGRIDKIVQNFLEFARPPKLRLEKSSLQKVVHSVLALMEYRLREFQVEIRYEPYSEPMEVLMDGDRIKEALVNLIINGCEATGPGGVVRICETREHDAKLGEVAGLCVVDDGPGIPEVIRDKVTVPFFTTKDDGSGLGLSIVARIAKEHGGRFVIDNDPEAGAKCCLYLALHGGDNEFDPDS